MGLLKVAAVWRNTCEIPAGAPTISIMSFDLYFCGSHGARLDIKAVRAWMLNLNHIEELRADDGSLLQFAYSNEATGFYCLFDLLTRTDPEVEELPMPSPYRGVGLSVSINFLRPHFFALEVMPIVSSAASFLNLSLYDSQEDKVYPPNVAPDVLIGNWVEHNGRATRATALNEEAPIRKPYLSSEQSNYWWRYMRAREDFQNTVGADVFVPSILPMVDPANNVKLTVIWSAEIPRNFWSRSPMPLPQIFPVCDYVLLAWGKVESGFTKNLVPYPIASSALATLLQEIDGPVEGLKVLRPQLQKRASSVYEKLPRTEFTGLTQIAPDGFVDVSL